MPRNSGSRAGAKIISAPCLHKNPRLSSTRQLLVWFQPNLFWKTRLDAIRLGRVLVYREFPSLRGVGNQEQVATGRCDLTSNNGSTSDDSKNGLPTRSDQGNMS